VDTVNAQQGAAQDAAATRRFPHSLRSIGTGERGRYVALNCKEEMH